ncbi:sigma-54-dependent Fis family transcriptional regulator [Paenibacillus marinisediminis]
MGVFMLLELGSYDLSAYAEKSRRRCHTYGMKTNDPFDDRILSGNQILEIVKQHQVMVKHAEQILEKMHHAIKQTGQIALLIDAEGHIIHVAGDPAFANRAEMVQLQVGANWNERRKGTNAIGVALIEQVPVSVHAEEHYFEANHFLTCASAPIFSPTGELLGVINISGKQENYSPHTLLLATMASDSIQNRLLLEQSKHSHLITLKELDYTVQQYPLPLLSLDSDNRIIRANQAALRIVGKDAVGKPFNGAKGFTIDTINDSQHKVWRSIAIQRRISNEHNLYTFQDIAGTCPALLQKKGLSQKAALTDYPVLLLGESGTGKELFAQSIHTSSSRLAQPFIALNCGAIPDNLVESELFGYERGAFTGANREGSIGKFEAAHKGTLFLDEIGNMSLRAQASLLRVLQEGTITPVGSTKSKRIDVRIIAATNKNLQEEIKAGTFRADLYYRLKGILITLPSLRERSDIMTIVAHLLQRQQYPSLSLTTAAEAKLRSYAWPGNIRELSSVLLQASFLAEGGPIGAEHLLLEHEEQVPEQAPLKQAAPSIKEAEIAAIKQALHLTGWNLSRAASLLKIGRTTLYRKLEEYGIALM